ncbi:bifunctional protein-serine/threonine kinase/phosphatase [Pseudothioclava arenosa]|uniref:Protein kinase n=1 Tax=Pseudothioclava arenosa TaxID=1795308 RepID=A0A2A4CLF2_9RHOB|nr:bifunctional protein-serine/threonine kinase/phosphatase [Pseudothioclava arenosa]PCD76081.1 protein kinase [Pseudothioclava arenosa]
MPKDQASPATLRVAIGQWSNAGVKPINQDFFGALVPEGSALALKGVVAAIADGITPSPVSHIAAETSVKALLTDYYATSDAETVKTAASKVIAATNSWLHAQSQHARQSNPDHGHICTLSALVLKARKGHLFHIGDSRVWRLSGETFEPLTEDHRVTLGGQSYLGRAMGLGHNVEIDYRSFDLAPGDIFVMTTDGVHEFWDMRAAARLLAGAAPGDAALAEAARAIGEEALGAGSDDNLTIQILRIEGLPDAGGADLLDGATQLPLIELPKPGDVLDGWRVIRPLHQNARSHVFLAEDAAHRRVALKFPALEMAQDPETRRRMMMEEWVARRLASPHLLSAPMAGARSGFYTVTDYVEGQSLRQWMHDHPKPKLEAVRAILEQVVRGMTHLHRREMLHQDIRPENILIDSEGTVKLIDFGSTYVSGVHEAAPDLDDPILGTMQYTAPEYFSGEPVSWQAELFSLGVIAYEMLSGDLPYGTTVSRVRSARDRMALRYRNLDLRDGMPDWVDLALERATNPDPTRRQTSLTEFVADLRRPSDDYVARNRRPLMARDPLTFWKSLSAFLALIVVILLVRLAS